MSKIMFGFWAAFVWLFQQLTFWAEERKSKHEREIQRQSVETLEDGNAGGQP